MSNSEQLTHNVNFNDEVVWDNNRKLFYIHFKPKLKRNEHQLVNTKARNNYDSFDKIVEELKTRFLNND